MLTPRQSAFVREYPIDMVGSAAAVRAGFSPRSAKVTASRLLAHPEVAAAIADALAQRASAAGLKAEDVIARVKYIMNCEPGEKWRGSEILRAIELAGRYLKLWEADEPNRSGMTFEQLVIAADRAYKAAEAAGRPLLAAVGVVDGQPAFLEDPYACRQRPSAGATVELAPEAPTDAPTTPAPAAEAPVATPAAPSKPRPGDTWTRSRLPWEPDPNRPRFAEGTGFNPLKRLK